MATNRIMTYKPHLFVIVAAAILLCSVTTAYAISYEYKEYTIKKGDTLWSITKRELVDAYQWPFVWMENRRINNPDLIYPGQVILIPVRALRPEEPEGKWPTPETVTAVAPDMGYPQPDDTAAGWAPPPPVPEPEKPEYKPLTKKLSKRHTRPIISKNVILESGYITKYIPDAGKIQGSPSGRSNFSKHDIIYIWTTEPVKKGRKFYTLRKMKKIIHPVTDEIMGWAIKVTGVIETLEAGDDKVRTKIIDSFDLIAVNDPIDYYSEFFVPVAPATPRSPDITGHVLTASYKRLISGGYDVMFIDKGVENGIEVGDIFITLLPKTDDSINGIFQVVNVRNKTSLALIYKSEQEITKGDTFRSFFDDQPLVAPEAFEMQ